LLLARRTDAVISLFRGRIENNVFYTDCPWISSRLVVEYPVTVVRKLPRWDANGKEVSPTNTLT